MDISAITSASNKTAVDTTDTATRVTQKTLGQDDFLQLLTVQLQKQDPMKPMDDTAFIAQMAQFSSLQEMQAMSGEMTSMGESQDIATANSYIGRAVAVKGSDGQIVSGEVSGVEISEGVPRIVIGDYSYALSSVVAVAPASALATTS